MANNSYNTLIKNYFIGSLSEYSGTLVDYPRKYTDTFGIETLLAHISIKNSTYCILCKDYEGESVTCIRPRIKYLLTVKTPKDLLGFVFSRKGDSVTEVTLGNYRYLVVGHSLFAVFTKTDIRPVFLAIIDPETYKLGITIFAQTLDKLNSRVRSTIMIDLTSTVNKYSGMVRMEADDKKCRWVAHSKYKGFSIGPEIGYEIAKYYDHLYTTGEMD